GGLPRLPLPSPAAQSGHVTYATGWYDTSGEPPRIVVRVLRCACIARGLVRPPAPVSGVRSGSRVSLAREHGVLRAVVRRVGAAGAVSGGRRRRRGWAGG